LSISIIKYKTLIRHGKNVFVFNDLVFGLNSLRMAKKLHRQGFLKTGKGVSVMKRWIGLILLIVGVGCLFVMSGCHGGRVIIEDRPVYTPPPPPAPPPPHEPGPPPWAPDPRHQIIEGLMPGRI